MSDNTSSTVVVDEECTACQLFLRVGIPAVVVFLLIVIGCIVWFDRHDKNRLQMKLQQQERRNEKKTKIQQQQQQQKHCTKSDSSDSMPDEPDLSLYTVTSSTTSILKESVEPNTDTIDLDRLERGHNTVGVASTGRQQSTATVISPAYRVQRFHTLIQQVHEENLKHLPTIQNDEEMNDDDDDDDDQSSIESDATPIVTNNTHSQQPSIMQSSERGPTTVMKTFIVQLPLSNDGTTCHADIGLIRNNLSIPGTTESESTSSSFSSSTSSSLSSSSCHSGDHDARDETCTLAV